MPDTSVKFLHSGMLGAPKVGLYDSGVVTAATVAQNAFDVLNAVLVSGFNTQTAARISVSGGVATLYFDNTHGFEQDAVVKVSGAAVSSLNGEKRVATTPSGTTLTFDAAGVPDQQVLTGSSVQYAPLGWSLSGTPTTLPATFYSTDPTGTGVAFTARRYNAFAIYIDAYRGFSGGAPNQAFAAGKALPVAAAILNSGGVSYGAWVVVGDGKTLHLLWHSPSTTGITLPSAFNGVLSSIGDFESLAPVDAHRALYHATQDLHSASSDAYGVQYLSTADMSGHAWLAGSAGGGAVTAVRFGLETLFDGTTRVAGASGSNVTSSYPNSPDSSLILSRRYIADNTGVRGFFRGLYQSPQPCAAAFAPFDRIEGQGPLAGRRLLAVRCGSGSSNSTLGVGVTFFDVTGPWA